MKMTEKFSQLEFTIDFGKRLRNERQRAEMSIVDFCKKMDVSRASQHLYENGSRLPSVEYLMKTTELGFDVIYLITGKSASNNLYNTDYNEEILDKAFEITDELSVDKSGFILDREFRKKVFHLIYKALLGTGTVQLDSDDIMERFKDLKSG